MNKKLNITKADARNAGGYCDNKSCLAATAAKRQFGVDYVSCGPIGITIGRAHYNFTRRAEQQIRRSYPNTSDPQKVKRGFKPFSVTLIPL